MKVLIRTTDQPESSPSNLITVRTKVFTAKQFLCVIDKLTAELIVWVDGNQVFAGKHAKAYADGVLIADSTSSQE